MLNIILFGPPGSGKGTQCQRLAATYGLKHLSTGELLREEIAAETEIGLEAKKLIDHGKLAFDDVVINIVKKTLKNTKGVEGFLFDGFPRTKVQAIALDNLLKERNDSVTVCLSLQVSEDELIKRLINRGLSSGRADDSSKKVILERLTEYYTKTRVVEQYYRQEGKAKKVVGEGDIDQVFNSLCFEINKFRNKQLAM